MKTINILITSCLIFLSSEITFGFGGPYQGNWRWRNDDGDVYTATWKDSLNIPIILTDYKNKRLRIEYLNDYADSLKISLRYSERPGKDPWIPITTVDTGKFFISTSQYLTDTISYFDNQLLPFDSRYSYIKTITFDETRNYLLVTDDSSKYELEYSLKPTSKVKPGSAYFFSLFRNSDQVELNGGDYADEYAVVMTPPVNWITQYSGHIYFRSVSFVDIDNGWVVGSGEEGPIVLKTTNAGETWIESGILKSFGSCIYFTDINNGWIVGGGWIFRTTNNGSIWNIQSFYGHTIEFSDVYFTDVNNGWAVGANRGAGSGEGNGVSFILRTTNGGETWNEQTNGKFSNLFSVSFIDVNKGFAVGASGTILKTTNGGELWSSKQIVGLPILLDVCFIDTLNGWAVGESSEASVILRTTNGGETWNEQTNGEFNSLFSVSFIDVNKGFAVGAYGTILRTTNGGQTWVEQTSGTANAIRGVSFVDANNVWAVAGSRILRSTNVGTTFIEEEKTKLPSTFVLNQNYPNPFNPTTTISYSVPKLTNVSLKIYDVLGREVETLVNENKPAGFYEVNWNAANLPSGVYFYRIQAGTFTETKKMMLMK